MKARMPKLPKRTSLRTRLTVWNVGVLALVLVVLGTILRYTTEANLMASVDRDLSGRAHRFVAIWSSRDENAFRRDAARRSRRFRASLPDHAPIDKYRPRLLNLQGRALFPQAADVPWDPRTFALSARGQERFSTLRVDGEPMRVFSLPLRRGAEITGVMQTAYPLTEVERDLRGLTRTLLTLIPLALLVAGIGGAFLTDRMLRPVRQITQAAGRIGAEDLSQRLPVRGQDEFSELASTFNGMLGRLDEAFTRLEQAFEQQRRFTADASHELRTPLGVILANTSLALSEEPTPAECRHVLEVTHRAGGRMNKIIQDLLLLARSDAGQLRLDLQAIPLVEVLHATVETVQGQGHAPISLSVSDPALAVLGDPNHLIRLFTNLLDNAVRHTPPAGRITLAAEADQTSVIVTVEDTGGGIPPEHLPHVCERFYRVDAARGRGQGGTGLGLAISQSIVESHHGTLAIESVLGEGTRVRVRLPRAAAPLPVTQAVSPREPVVAH